jgi:hypothetical protein
MQQPLKLDYLWTGFFIMGLSTSFLGMGKNRMLRGSLTNGSSFSFAIGVSLILHLAVGLLLLGKSFVKELKLDKEAPLTDVIFVPIANLERASLQDSSNGNVSKESSVIEEEAPQSLDAPPAPTAEEWALASTYTLKNSKRYRYAWGQQVRSMMGTAVEGPDQGMVRFSIEIAPGGEVTRVDTVWSTSEKAERLARAAISSLPSLPPTPTGRPLIFEKTISFQPFEMGWPPIYKYDCIPDPPKRPYPWAWDGVSTPDPPGYEAAKKAQVQAPTSDPTECPDVPEDSLEAEAASMQRQFDLWESSRLKTHKQ